MINREQLINEIAEVVNRNSMEKAFNDTPDFILARIAVEAMEMFTRASAHRDDYHGFRMADYDRKYKAICESEKKAKPVNTCKGCPLIDVCPGINDGSQYPGMSYEDGIQQFWLWVTVETNEKPFE